MIYIQNAELESRIQQLKAQFANREYDEMTRNVDFNVRNIPCATTFINAVS